MTPYRVSIRARRLPSWMTASTMPVSTRSPTSGIATTENCLSARGNVLSRRRAMAASGAKRRSSTPPRRRAGRRRAREPCGGAVAAGHGRQRTPTPAMASVVSRGQPYARAPREPGDGHHGDAINTRPEAGRVRRPRRRCREAPTEASRSGRRPREAKADETEASAPRPRRSGGRRPGARGPPTRGARRWPASTSSCVRRNDPQAPARRRPPRRATASPCRPSRIRA